MIFEFDELRKNYSLEDFVSVKLAESVANFFIEQKKDNPTFEALLYLNVLRRIILDYILIPKFDEETVFNKICDNFNKRLSLEEARSMVGLYPDQYCKEGYWIGMEDFIEYRETLETEKNIFGFRNMLNIYFKTKSGQYKR